MLRPAKSARRAGLPTLRYATVESGKVARSFSLPARMRPGVRYSSKAWAGLDFAIVFAPEAAEGDSAVPLAFFMRRSILPVRPLVLPSLQPRSA
jgi:hypothetical protein